MTYTIFDRDGKEIANGETVMDIAGEESNLWRDEDGEGEFVEYGMGVQRGDERDFVWRNIDGAETVVGSIVCE